MARTSYIAVGAASPAEDSRLRRPRLSLAVRRGSLLCCGVVALLGAVTWLHSERQQLRPGRTAAAAGEIRSAHELWQLKRLDSSDSAGEQSTYANSQGSMSLAHQQDEKSMKKKVFVYTEPCDCSWASNSSCARDSDDSECFKACCTNSMRQCPNRGSCLCDCTWANKKACALDDGGCCWGCCCLPLEGVFHTQMEPPAKCFEAEDPMQYRLSTNSLFCFSLIIPDSYEVSLLRMQHKAAASIFACDGFAIYSNKSFNITPTITSRVAHTSLTCEYGGEFGTALNTDIFKVIWDKVYEDGQYRLYSWTAKVDADTVFFPWRLRVLLLNHQETNDGVYLNNCVYGLHGPLEVFSRNGVTTWIHGQNKCVEFFKQLCKGPCWWGEDMYIDQCLAKVLGVRRDNTSFLLVEDHCDPPKGWRECDDPLRLSFHPFKKQSEYKNCLHNANSRCPMPAAAAPPTTSTTTTLIVTSTVAALEGGGMSAVNPTHNCGDGQLAWWSDEKKEYCCESVGWGCESKTEKKEKQDAVLSDGCRNACPYNANPDGTCSTHTQTIAEQIASSNPDACKHAYVMTVQMCPVCQNCPLDRSGCNVSALIKAGAAAGGGTGHSSAAEHTSSKGPVYTDQASSATTFNCSRGLDNWELEWSLDKMSWCCKHKFLGCVNMPSQSSADSEWGGGSEALAAGADADVEATVSPTTMAPWFDCNEGFWDWEHLWAGQQKKWCCANLKRGCEDSVGFDCDEDLGHWEDAWSGRKKKYCCKLGKPGCSMFDCKLDFASVTGGWSSEKSRWCCKYEGKGCGQVQSLGR